jgi:triacylglycerol lipase
MRKAQKLKYWLVDYLHMLRGHAATFLYREPSHYRGYVIEGKPPIILIPGVYSKWQFLKKIADTLSLAGHPIYTIPKLGYHTESVARSAALVRELINEKKLEKVIILAHSKGGLVGKYLLAYGNSDERVVKVIAIATPFQGSHVVRFLPFGPLRELHPESGLIKDLYARHDVNGRIVSIYGTKDNHVWPSAHCILDGAKNIQVPVNGHHKILFSKKVLEIVKQEVETA